MLDPPTLGSPQDIAAALRAVSGAVAAGDLSPEEGLFLVAAAAMLFPMRHKSSYG
jgi:hypothetical protein